jgi:hypothetical protein
MDKKRSQSQTAVSVLVSSVKTSPSDLIKWTSALSALGSLIVLIIHAVSIRYLPDLGVSDIATVLSVTLLMETAFVLAFAMMMVAPAVVMFLSIGAAQQVSRRQKHSGNVSKGTKDLPLMKAVALHLFVWACLSLWLLAIPFCSSRGDFAYTAAFLPVFLSFIVELACHMYAPSWVVKERPFWDRSLLQGFSLLVQAGTGLMIMPIALKSNLFESQETQVVYLAAILLTVAVLNVGLLAILRHAKHLKAKIAPFAGSVLLITFVQLGSTFEDAILRKMGLAFVDNVTLAIDSKFYSKAAQYGLGCINSPATPPTEPSVNMCVIKGNLVTRVGQNYVLQRSSKEAATGGDRSTNYFIVPKDHAIWIPSS